MRILGIDASLTSTGVCVAECQFLKYESEYLLNVLLDQKRDSTDRNTFQSSFFIQHLDQIMPKDVTKKLIKVRKRIREDSKIGHPSMADINEEILLCDDRIRMHTDVIEKLYREYRPHLVLMEDYSYKSQGSLIQLAEMKGYMKSLLTPCIFLAPITCVKKVGSTKGNANKRVMWENITRFLFNKKLLEERDDEIDALAVCVSAFYAIYNRVIGFDFPKCKLAKDRTKIKSWEKSLNLFGNHIGNEIDLKKLIDME